MTTTARPQRVMHLITALKGGGAEALLAALVTRPSPSGVQHEIVSMCDDGDLGARIRAAGIPVHLLGMAPGRPGPRGALALWRLMSRLRPDVVHAWMYHANLLAALLAPARRTPLVWALHAAQLDASHYGRLSAWTMRACAALSRVPDVIVANTQLTRDDHLRQGYRARRWEIVPNGFDFSRFRPDADARGTLRAELGVPADAPLVGLMARWDVMKDQPTFLAAARLVAQHRPDVHFVLAGQQMNGENRALVDLVRELGIESRTHLLGFRTDVPHITAALDIATSTSLFGESFSNTIAEAMACAVPCVVTDVTVLPALVGDTGRVVPRQDPPALADAIRQLLALPADERSALGAAARARVSSQFSLERMARGYEAIYDELAGGRRSA